MKRFEHLTEQDVKQSITDKVVYTISIVLVIIFIVLMFSGCATTKQVTEPVVITKHVVTEKIVPVMPTIPRLYCNFEGQGTEPIAKLLDCLVMHKKVIDKLIEEAEKFNKESLSK